MRFWVLTIAMFFVGSLAVVSSAQVSPPPPKPAPPPAVREEPCDPSAHGFKASFPGAATMSRIERDSSFGKNTIVSCQLSTVFASYVVTYTDFPTVMDDRYDINSRFDLMRDSQARRINAVVMADSELEFGSYYGRLNVFESPTETLSMRSLFVGPRLYILIVGTKGRLSAQSPTLKAANRKRIDDFFNSFAITRVPEAKSVPVELPDDFGVSVTNGTFTSAFFGSRMSLPAGWTSLEKGDSDLLLEMGKDELKRTQPGLADHITEKTARVLAAFSRSQPSQGVPDAFMLVLAERAPYPNFLPSALASTYEKLYVDRNEQVTKPPSSVRINGIEFSMVETFNTGSKLYHRLFFANRNGIAFEVSMIYLRPDALPPMLAALETLRFGPESK